MSEAELYWMRLRLHGGQINKARRGEYAFLPPAGYEWEAVTSRFRFDPDEIARFLAGIGEPTCVPDRSPPRGPPYWKSTVLRRKAA